jgi:5'-nucleotidase
MKLLLTNDDGIAAEGLAALARAAADLGEIFCAAPHTHLSGCSHRVTTDEPLRVTRHAPGRWAVEGTPADCVRVGLAHLAPDVDWILSGLNHGGNLGADVHVSGTVAAVREAILHGKRGIALSQYRYRDREVDWDRSAGWIAALLGDLMARSWTPGTFWNVNLPSLRPGDPEPRVVFCPLETSPHALSFREEAGVYHYNANYHERPRRPGSDVAVCFGGDIAVTKITVFDS